MMITKLAILCAVIIKIIEGQQYISLNLTKSNQKLINYKKLLEPTIWLNRVVQASANGANVTNLVRSQYNQATKITSHVFIQLAKSQNSSNMILSAYNQKNASCLIIGNNQTKTYKYYVLNQQATQYTEFDLKLYNFYNSSTNFSEYKISTPFQSTLLEIVYCEALRVNNIIFYNNNKVWQSPNIVQNIKIYDHVDVSAVISGNSYLWRQLWLLYKNFDIPGISDYNLEDICLGYWNYWQARTIVMAWKYVQNESLYYYRVIVTGSVQKLQYQQIVGQFNGTSTSKPQFYFFQDSCNSFIIKTTLDNQFYYIIKKIYIDSSQKYIVDVVTPEQIYQNDLQLFLTTNYLYVKNKNISNSTNSQKQHIYRFQQSSLYPIKQSNFNSSQYVLNSSKLWQQTSNGIFTHAIRYYYFSDKNQQFYLKRELIKSEFQFNIQEQKSSSQMTTYFYQIVNDSDYKEANFKTKLLKNKNQVSNIWVYTYNRIKLSTNYFNIDIIIYQKQNNQSADHTIKKHYETSIPLNYAFSYDLTCSLLAYKDYLKIVKFNTQSQTFQETLVSDSKLAQNPLNMAVSSLGNAFYINPSIYYKSSSGQYQKAGFLQFPKPRLAISKNFDFVFYNTAIYEYLNSSLSYSQIVSDPPYSISSQEQENLTHLRANIKVSSDKSKLVLISVLKKSDTERPVYSKTFVLILHKKNNAWKLIYNFTKYANSTKEIISPNFDVFSFQYHGYEYLNTSSRTEIFYLDYQNQKVYNLSGGSYSKKYNFYLQNIDFLVSSNFSYLRNLTHEVIYKINKPTDKFPNATLTEWKTNEYDESYTNISAFIHVAEWAILYESENQLDIIYQVENESQPLNFEKYIKLFRRTINLTQNNSVNFYLQTQERGYLLDANNSVYMCSPACEICYTRKTCRKCINGYVVDIRSQICLKCRGSCKSCQTQQPEKCLNCFSTYFLSDKLCRKCHPSCLECSYEGELSCTKCSLGSSLLTINEKNEVKCLQCPQNCEICQNNPSNKSLTLCKNCSYGFGVNSVGKCQQCILGCRECNGDNLTICRECSDHYYKNSSVTNQNVICFKCLNNCQVCTSSDKCDQCAELFELNNNKSACVLICKFPCKQCQSSNSSKCISCIEGYKLQKSNQTCQPYILCKDTSTCLTCPLNYTLLNSKCQICLEKNKCNSCSKNDFSICLTCQKGSFLENNQCINCPLQCSQCVNAFVCIKCNEGYMATQSNQQSICIKCSTNCKSCIHSKTNCLSCYDSYQLEGFQCTLKNQVIFSFTIDYQFYQLTTDKLMKIRKQLADFTGKLESDIIFQTIKPGSVLIEGKINSKDLSDQLKVTAGLKIIGATGSIGGFSVLQSQFNSTLIDTPEQKTSLVVILVPVIGGTALIILAIGLIFYFNNNRRIEELNEQEEKQQMQEYGTMNSDKNRRNRIQARKIGNRNNKSIKNSDKHLQKGAGADINSATNIQHNDGDLSKDLKKVSKQEEYFKSETTKILKT